MAQQAIGLIETRGLVALVEATDAMLKAANITLVGQVQIGGAYITTIVKGDIGSVRAAVDAGSQIASQVGELVSAHVIARPDPAVIAAYLGQKSDDELDIRSNEPRVPATVPGGGR